MNGAEVWTIFEGYAAQVGVGSATFYDNMNNSTMTYEVTKNWKYGASRGVWATPSYLCEYFKQKKYLYLFVIFSKWCVVIQCFVGFKYLGGQSTINTKST